MPASIKPNLKAEPGADKLHAVRIRVYTEQPARYYDTKLRIAKKHWNTGKGVSYEKKNWIKDTHPQFDTYNQTIRKLVDEFIKIAQDNPYATAAEIISIKKSPPPVKGKGYFAYCKEYIKRMNDLEQFDNAGFHEFAVHLAKSFVGEKISEKEYLTNKSITKFKKFLEGNNKDKKTYAASTINVAISALDRMYRGAVFEGWIEPVGQPFKITPALDVDQEKPRPTAIDIFNLATLPLKKKKQIDARNIGLMLYFMAGARISEALKLRWDKNIKPDRIRYLPGKRATKTKTISRHAGIEWILSQYPPDGKSRYVFPYLTPEADKLDAEGFREFKKACIAIINYYLGTFSKQLKLPYKLSTRMMRRAYIDAANEESGDIRITQKGVGHSSVVVTEIYSKDPDQAVIDDMNDAVFSEFAKLEIPGKS